MENWAKTQPTGRGPCRSAVGCSTWTPAPGPFPGELADATGHPLASLMSCGRPAYPVRPVILVRAPHVPVPTATHG
jgi:hypothetical protein